MIVSPSVLSLNYADTSSQIKELNASGAAWMHFDVMDGHFVPNLTFGPDILKAFAGISPLVKDVHIMVDDPDFISDIFLNAGADIVTFHEEAVKNIEKIRAIAKKIQAKGAKAGLSIKPGTPLEQLKPYLNDFDLFLIMSVEPGFGGQKFMPEAAQRISTLKTWLHAAGSHAYVEVDGGINRETGLLCAEAGADVLVAGSYVFKNNIREAVQTLCQLPSSH